MCNPDFPGMKVQVAVLMNSKLGPAADGATTLCGLLPTAFDEAWIAG